jgi:hypothetical protein
VAKPHSPMKKSLLALCVAGLWITASEFIRNELVFKSYWTGHYANLGLKFATLPVNGILWTVWSFVFAAIIAKLLSKFTFLESVAYAWVAGFVLMWICLYNLQVLPSGLLYFAVPLSLLEVTVAAWIIRRIQGEPGAVE